MEIARSADEQISDLLFSDFSPEDPPTPSIYY